MFEIVDCGLPIVDCRHIGDFQIDNRQSQIANGLVEGAEPQRFKEYLGDPSWLLSTPDS